MASSHRWSWPPRRRSVESATRGCAGARCDQRIQIGHPGVVESDSDGVQPDVQIRSDRRRARRASRQVGNLRLERLLLDPFGLEFVALDHIAQRAFAHLGLHPPPDATQRPHDVPGPLGREGGGRANRRSRKPADGHPGPAAEQHHVDVDVEPVLKGETGVRHAMEAIDPCRKPPEVLVTQRSCALVSSSTPESRIRTGGASQFQRNGRFESHGSL